jgi:integrase
MGEVFRRGGLTYSLRVHIPRARQADVGQAFGSPNGIKAEVVRTLETKNRGEAIERAKDAERAIWAEVNHRLREAELPPIGRDWRAQWMERAAEHRDRLRVASDSVVYSEEDDDGGVTETTERDFLLHDGGLLDEVRQEARQLRQSHGADVAQRFERAAFETRSTIGEATARWVAELRASRSVRVQTIAGHEAVFRLLGDFLRTRQLSSDTLALGDVGRRTAKEYLLWRAAMSSPKGGGPIQPATLRRELSSLSGLWRWARRDGAEGVEGNPWEDQAATVAPRVRPDAEDDQGKRPYSPAELVALLRATGDDWAPNGGGYGPALWDAVRLGLLTGLRANELAGLRCGDVKDGGAVVAVVGGKSRNARREVPLCEPARLVIAARLAALPGTSPSDPLFPEIPAAGLDAPPR